MAAGPDWLTARPIAHRGLHDRAGGIIENSLSAARAAIAGNYAIECDVQPSADGEAIVFHDFALERLTGQKGRVDELAARQLTEISLSGSADLIPSFADLLALVAGRVPIVCEVKSRFDGDMRLADRIAQLAAAYTGPLCLESFDPRVMAHLRANAPPLGLTRIPLGMIGQANYDDPSDEWAVLSADERRALAEFLHYPETLPDFISFGVRDLPHAVPFLFRVALGLPVTTWAVRTPDEIVSANRWADQMVFEGFRP